MVENRLRPQVFVHAAENPSVAWAIRCANRRATLPIGLAYVCGPRRPAQRFDGIVRAFFQHTARPTLLVGRWISPHDLVAKVETTLADHARPPVFAPSWSLGEERLDRQTCGVPQVTHTFPSPGYGHDRSAAAALRPLAIVRRLHGRQWGDLKGGSESGDKEANSE